ncbi:tRNA adenosine deaminase-associated protein [Rhodococcus aerolatus]
MSDDRGRDDRPEGWGVAVVREDGLWRCTPMPAAALVDLAAAVRALREMRSAGAVFGMLDVDDEFFVLLRPRPGGVALLLSDATAALDYDLAAEVLDAVGVPVPDAEDADDAGPWPEGDLDLLADLGLPGPVLGALLADDDLYADEQLELLAERCGFGDELARVLDALPG